MTWTSGNATASSSSATDGPRRFAATRTEALHALRDFVAHRLPHFGAHEDAILQADAGWRTRCSRARSTSACSTRSKSCSAPNRPIVTAPHRSRRWRGSSGRWSAGATTCGTCTGTCRAVIGTETNWRHHPRAEVVRRPRPDGLDAACLADDVAQCVRERGWVHHIPRLMVLGNYAMQRGWRPAQVTDWFHRAFVDGYDWVMVPNVVGMSQHADGGVMATKPYAGGGAYIDRMSDYCGDAFDPRAGRRRRVPVHRRVLGIPAQTAMRSPATTASRSRCAAWIGCATWTRCWPTTPAWMIGKRCAIGA